jgi:hypothetical protein
MNVITLSEDPHCTVALALYISTTHRIAQDSRSISVLADAGMTNSRTQ